ncbi:D-alanine--D-alanine ligase [Fervidobacterium changbaicum]|uniref:D-alanine--D-alanine ligase n=2 Tax=Fervidobacterium TaxID=2422 RepID=A0AAI8GDQ9_FERIS|nr:MULTISPECIES: D-alanine--D-alanine ligase [Fervidobacterium]AMW33374.1 D-alanine--D-alanine ligase [Fervidobacterium islandicum]QAV33413.1 D-alanine--D-alanine ligase [Fervidobacterium changbaicum]SDG91682.1 D-alanine--D-alanine ligase [Fervidobacterium changbaicum]
MKIAVLLGGISREREISIRSGKRIAQALKKFGHEVDEIDFTLAYMENLKQLKNYDAIFNILHGTFGEDGHLQAILDALEVPYTGSGMETSMIAFDKYICNLYVQDVAHVPKFLLLTRQEFTQHGIEKVKQQIGLPCVIKPRKEGSSIGTHICFSEAELLSNLNCEFQNYEEMIVQEYVKGTEITVSIIDIDGVPSVLPILELRPKKLFYDYEAKYTDGMTEFVIPAQIGEEMTKTVENIALRIYNKLGCKHFARVDGIISNGTFYFLEVNTLPGMTELSDLPMSAKAYGLSFEELVNTIINEAYKNPPFEHWIRKK